MTYLLHKLLNKSVGLLFSKRQALNKLSKLLISTPNPSILFVCSGNICRSPYGECYLKSINKHNIDIKSAGLDTQDGLLANIVAIKEAKKRNLDLESHRTTALTKELIEKSDIILFMEPIHVLKSLTRFPLLNISKYYLLGLLADPPLTSKVAVDPYGRDAETFETTFQIIESACNKLNNLIKH